MPHRKRYKKYLYDSACEVPVRTKCRRKALDDENGGGGGTSASDSDEDSRSAHERRSESTCCDRGSSLPSSPLADSSCDDESFSDIAENAFVCSNDGNINAADTLRYDSSSSEDEESNQGTEEAEQTRNELDGPLYPESKLSRGQSLVMVMAHSLRHHSSKEATESLLKVIDAHMPQGPCTIDTVARCMVMNMTQFNGSHGCAWCEQTGEVVQRGRGRARIYPVQEPEPKQRTPKSFARHVDKAHRSGKPSCGIKGASVLFFMAFIQFPSSFVVDYMHAVCNGFVRTTAFLWFSHKRQNEFSLGSHLQEINERLSQLTPVWETTRLPRSLLEMKYWKASEWRDWLLFFSPVVLKGFLPSRYYKNWMKFVAIMHFCLQSSIPMVKIRKVRRLMVQFLKDYEELYGQESMTYNAHILVHMVDHVDQWGPLWGFSAFSFESMNGRLVSLVNGTRYAHMQIIEKFTLLTALQQVVPMSSGWKSEELQSFVKSLLKGYSLRKSCVRKGAVALYGKGIADGGLMTYKKATIGAFTYCVNSMDKSRRKNSYVVTSAGLFGQGMINNL
ncbi:hypothetical protein HPB49_026311 [Dermacentor silvarum]|nr:hypothetical protein HPB49_026311 [Dermacentor silvarum]